MQEKKAENVTVVDLRNIDNAVCDFFVISNANSNTQVNAIADSVQKETLETLGDKAWQKEGTETLWWLRAQVAAHASADLCPDDTLLGPDASADPRLKEEEASIIRESAVSQALEVLRNRIDSLGISEPSLQKQGVNNIVIQLPGLKDRDRAIELIGPQAILQFQIVNLSLIHL